MRLRMYVTLPDLAAARQLANDLLLARVEDRHMHFLARRGSDLGELHEATYLQKTDAVHGAFTGLVIGGVVGVIVGVLLLYFPPGGASIQMAAVLIAALVGAALGVWIAGMMGLQVPNTQLKGFEQEIQEGKILLMLDVPASRYDEVRSVIARSQPQAVNRGNEPMVPAFP
jgi:uncharacterized membrane protein YeaQ/YmgE (transglycosylase-associated protein family)